MPEKKSFKTSNPALSFIGVAADSVSENKSEEYQCIHTYTQNLYPEKKPNQEEGVYVYARPHVRRENKSRRLQLLIKPSIHAGISGIARNNGTSVNDTINTILEEYLRKGAI